MPSPYPLRRGLRDRGRRRNRLVSCELRAPTEPRRVEEGVPTAHDNPEGRTLEISQPHDEWPDDESRDGAALLSVFAHCSP